MADGLTRLLAPILSFTADELWRYLPGRDEEAVHLALFPRREELVDLGDSELLARWNRLTTLRERVLAEIEPLRKDKRIGSSLQARVVLQADGRTLDFLEQHAAELPMLFIVSEVELRKAPDGVVGPDDVRIAVERAPGVKCERCWRYVPAVSSEPEWAGLCERCQDALAEPIHG
jgi:isoleucyl-tRNA synthetase